MLSLVVAPLPPRSENLFEVFLYLLPEGDLDISRKGFQRDRAVDGKGNGKTAEAFLEGVDEGEGRNREGNVNEGFLV